MLSHRSPVVNRGYFTRVSSIEHILRCFLDADDSPKQILSLGAGFDTLYFRFRDLPTIGLWAEIDMPKLVAEKAKIIGHAPDLAGILEDAPYRAAGADITDSGALVAAMEQCGVDVGVPTLVLLECVTAYLEADQVRRLLAFLSGHLERAVVLGYDPMSRPEDRFGVVMVENLRRRGIMLPSLMAFPTCEARAELLRETGWTAAECIDKNRAYTSLISPSERARIERLEFLDEYEELRLLFAHYCFWWAEKRPLGQPDRSLLRQPVAYSPGPAAPAPAPAH